MTVDNNNREINCGDTVVLCENNLMHGTVMSCYGNNMIQLIINNRLYNMDAKNVYRYTTANDLKFTNIRIPNLFVSGIIED